MYILSHSIVEDPFAFLEVDGSWMDIDTEVDTYTYAELITWFNKHDVFGVITCDTDEDFMKAAALEIKEGKKRPVYNDCRFWEVHGSGTHADEKGAYKIIADMLSTNKDMIVVPNHPVNPSHWVYYSSTGSVLPEKK